MKNGIPLARLTLRLHKIDKYLLVSCIHYPYNNSYVIVRIYLYGAVHRRPKRAIPISSGIARTQLHASLRKQPTFREVAT